MKASSGFRKQHRPHADSLTAASLAMENAWAELKPPLAAELDKRYMPYWLVVVATRATQDWDECSLLLAAQLAEVMGNIVDEKKLLKDEGTVVKSEKGWPAANPRSFVIDRLHRREFALLRMLKISSIQSGDPRDLVKARDLERFAKKVAEGRDEEDTELLARPPRSLEP